MEEDQVSETDTKPSMNQWRKKLSRGLSRRVVPSTPEGPGTKVSRQLRQTAERTEQTSPLLHLPGEVRNLIYQFAFNRSTEEILQYLQFGPPTNDASGLLLTCRQTRRETLQLAHDTAVTVFPTASPKDPSGFAHSVLPRPWKSSCKANPEYRPDKLTIKRLALQTMLFKHPRNSLEDLLHGAPLTGTAYVPEVFFLQICLCNAIHWLHDHPDFIMPFCIAIERLAMAYRTLNRIVIYYCGREWPSWVQKSGEIDFPNIVHGRHLIRGYSGANWNLREVERPSEGTCRKRCELSWNYFQAHPGQSVDPNPVLHHEITIDYYDSFSVSGTSCVGMRPVRKAEENTMTKVPTTVQKDGSCRPSRLSTFFKSMSFQEKYIMRHDPDTQTSERNGPTTGILGRKH